MNRELKRIQEHRTYTDNLYDLGKGVFSTPSSKRRTSKKRTSRMLSELEEYFTECDNIAYLGRGVFSKPLSSRRHLTHTLFQHRSSRRGKKYQADIPSLSYDSLDRGDELVSSSED
jgi:hypothetical protein